MPALSIFGGDHIFVEEPKPIGFGSRFGKTQSFFCIYYCPYTFRISVSKCVLNSSRDTAPVTIATSHVPTGLVACLACSIVTLLGAMVISSAHRFAGVQSLKRIIFTPSVLQYGTYPV